MSVRPSRRLRSPSPRAGRRASPPTLRSQAAQRRLALEPLELRCLLSVDMPLADGAAELAPDGLAALSVVQAPQAWRSIDSPVFAVVEQPGHTPVNAGLLMVFDRDAGAWYPLDRSLTRPGEGFSGLTFSLDGQVLYATTLAAGQPASRLLTIAPHTLDVLASRPITVGGQAISVGDLAVHPQTGDLYALRTANDQQGGSGSIYRVDLATGAATLVVSAPAGWEDGLAIGPDGTLYASGADAGEGLFVWSPSAGGHTLMLSDSLGNWRYAAGLAWSHDDAALLGSDARAGDLFRIDPASGQITLLPRTSPQRGVVADVALVPPAAPQGLKVIYEEYFESGDGGYLVDNTGGTLPGLWHSSIGRRSDGLTNHTPIRNWYYGAFETSTGGGRYNLAGGDHEGEITSPVITLPCCGPSFLSFSYVLDTRPELDRDHAEVIVRYTDAAGGVHADTILSRAEGTLVQTAHGWETATYDLSAYACMEIQLVFRFDTGDTVLIDPEGWYVDDVVIVSALPDVRGYKWDDRDGDGQWDPGEPGLDGVTIHLDENSDGVPEQTTVTAFDGMHHGVYTFYTNLPAGSPVAVWEEPPAGTVNTFPGTALHLLTTPVCGQWEATEPPNFGNGPTPPGALSGYKWEDLDRDGAWDAGETGVANWLIYLDSDGDGAFDPGEPLTLTDASGRYQFTGLAPGSYTVREVLLPDWEQTFPMPSAGGVPPEPHGWEVTLSAGQTIAGQPGVAELPNFGNWFIEEPLGSIAGYKWEDRDHDGQWDPGEPGLAGWTIYLDLDGDGQPGLDEPARVTDSSGQYRFSNLPADTYTVREVVPDGWEQTFPLESHGGVPPTPFGWTVPLAPGQELAGRFNEAERPNFGNWFIEEPLGSIAGYKWEDRDRDGVWDSGEQPLAGWVIYLDDDGDGQRGLNERAALTDAAGRYSFDDLAAGAYVVRELLPEHWVQTFPRTSDGGALPEPFGWEVQLSAGENREGDSGLAEPLNFGNREIDISGYKWEDVNHNGVWDAGEPGINGWAIHLDEDNDGTPEQTFVTRNDGRHDGAFWFFVDAPPGTPMTVTEELPECWRNLYPGTTEHAVTTRLHGDWEQTEPPNFGNRMVDVGGFVWDDRDGDGLWDAGEPGLNGWTIYLDEDADGVPDQTFVTRNDGLHDGAFWFFVDLPLGTVVTVWEEPREGWDNTYPGTGQHQGSTPLCGGWEAAEPPNFGNHQQPQVVQFITPLSVFRPDGTEEPPPDVIGRIEGYAWFDVDQDGEWDEDEPPQPGFEVYLDLNDNAQWDSGEPSTTTGRDGWYCFGQCGTDSDLAPGTYVIRERLDAPWQRTYPSASDSHQATVSTFRRAVGEYGVAEAPNFGHFTDYQISGYKWHDLDIDGVWDPGEPGMKGWKIYADTPVEPDFYPAGTLLNDVNPLVHLTALGVGDDDVPASELGPGDNVFGNAASDPTGVPTWNATRQLRIDFARPQIEVRIDAIGARDTASTARLRVFDVDGDLLGTDAIALIEGAVETLVVRTGTKNIAYAIADVEGGGAVWFESLWSVVESAVTAADGRYVFAGLEPFIYRVREEQPFEVTSYPSGGTLPLGALYPVQIDPTQPPLVGTFGVAEAPNFGGFDYAPFVRPADASPEWLLSGANASQLLAAWKQWQSFHVTNSTSAAFDITRILRDIQQGSPYEEWVTVYNDRLQPLVFNAADELMAPITVAPGETVEFYVFFQPVGPTWREGAPLAPFFTFDRDDRLLIFTNGGMEPLLEVQLVGGATFDSDITYDGVVSGFDVELLDSLIVTPKWEGGIGWDPTADIDTSTYQTLTDPYYPSGHRAIDLGDMGALVAELDRIRAPFLDLDWDNSSGALGVDYDAGAYSVPASAIPIADDDAGFRSVIAQIALGLDSLTVTLLAPPDDGNENIGLLSVRRIGGAGDVFGTADGAGNMVLELTPDVLRAAGYSSYDQALLGLFYVNVSADPTPGLRTIAMTATGEAGLSGNTAIATVSVLPVSTALSALTEPVLSVQTGNAPDISQPAPLVSAVAVEVPSDEAFVGDEEEDDSVAMPVVVVEGDISSVEPEPEQARWDVEGMAANWAANAADPQPSQPGSRTALSDGPSVPPDAMPTAEPAGVVALLAPDEVPESVMDTTSQETCAHSAAALAMGGVAVSEGSDVPEASGEDQPTKATDIAEPEIPVAPDRRSPTAAFEAPLLSMNAVATDAVLGASESDSLDRSQTQLLESIVGTFPDRHGPGLRGRKQDRVVDLWYATYGQEER